MFVPLQSIKDGTRHYYAKKLNSIFFHRKSPEYLRLGTDSAHKTCLKFWCSRIEQLTYSIIGFYFIGKLQKNSPTSNLLCIHTCFAGNTQCLQFLAGKLREECPRFRTEYQVAFFFLRNLP